MGGMRPDAVGDATGLQQKLLEAIRNSLTHSEQWDLPGVALHLAMAAVLSWILGRLYIRYGRSLSNRRAFASNFILLTMSTMVIITIVKSSLALSLGLVGALSIVRYRTAIKEPEELSFLLLAITIGLGFGAHQPKTTMVAFVLIGAVIALRGRFSTKKEGHHLNLIVTATKNLGVSFERICEVLQTHCKQSHMRRFEQSKEDVEATFVVAFKDFSDFEACRKSLTSLHPQIDISYIDHQSYL